MNRQDAIRSRNPSRRFVIALALMLSASGCSIAGSWVVTEWSAGEAAGVSVVSAVTLTTDGRFTLTEMREDRRDTTTGRYTFGGGRLTLEPNSGGRREWECSYRGGASMELATDRWTATLRRRDTE